MKNYFIKEAEIVMFVTTLMYLEAIMLSEINQSDFTYIWSLKNKINEQIKPQ